MNAKLETSQIKETLSLQEKYENIDKMFLNVYELLKEIIIGEEYRPTLRQKLKKIIIEINSELNKLPDLIFDIDKNHFVNDNDRYICVFFDHFYYSGYIDRFLTNKYIKYCREIYIIKKILNKFQKKIKINPIGEKDMNIDNDEDYGNYCIPTHEVFDYFRNG